MTISDRSWEQLKGVLPLGCPGVEGGGMHRRTVLQTSSLHWSCPVLVRLCVSLLVQFTSSEGHTGGLALVWVVRWTIGLLPLCAMGHVGCGAQVH